MSTVLALVLATVSPLFAADDAATDDTEPAEEEAEWSIEDAHGPHHMATISVTEGTWISVSVHGDQLVFDLLGDLWHMPITGGTATQLSDGASWDSEPRFSPDGSRIAFTSDRDGNEQIWTMAVDGSDAKQLTHEDEARVTDPVWDPEGPWIIARRRTIDTRSIGVTELWQFHRDGGKGIALSSKDNHPHAGEITTDGHRIWFSSRHGRFDYDSNPTTGLWRIMRHDRQTGEKRVVLRGAGSAARPLVTPDGSGLVFISRDRTQTLLEHFDFQTRKRRVIADWLDHDQMEGFALHGVYPSMDWTEDGELVLWAGGKLWRMALDGTRTEIPFRAEGEWRFHDVSRSAPKTEGDVVAKVIRWPSVNQWGDVAVSAMGQLWLVDRSGASRQVSGGAGFSPDWSPDGKTLLWTSYSDDAGTGALHLTHGRGRGRTQTLPIGGVLLNPTMSADGNRIVLLRDPQGGNSPNLGNTPWYELVLLERTGRKWVAEVLPITVDTGTGFRAPRVQIHGDRIWWLARKSGESRKPSKSVFQSVNLLGTDKREHLVFPGAVEAMPSPDFKRIAYKLDHQGFITAMPPLGTTTQVEDLPTLALTDVVGDWLDWAPDSQAVTWVAGPTFHRRPLPEAGIPAEQDATEEDATEAEDPVQRRPLEISLPRSVPGTILALTHATVLPMDGPPVEDATVVITGERITSVKAGGAIPAGAEVMDCTAKTIIPGLIDVHGHMHYSANDVHPEQPWAYQTSLDFGVTTVHDPSASTDFVFTAGERVEAGLMKGPRIFSTGSVLYGALGNENAKTADEEAAANHVARLKLVGAHSVKVYQQSRRDQRQWYVSACNDAQMLCVAEGGGDLWMNLSMVADGFHAIEHALPNAPVYADVRAFMAASHTDTTSGVAYTPTLLVAYGGLSGEGFFYQHHDPHDDPRLLRHWDRRDLDRRTWRTRIVAHDGDWNHQQVARDASAMAEAGVLLTLGAHGQLQGLGAHWELWALGGEGAMTPMAALEAATLNGAKYLGLEDELGSITAGKWADLIVLDADPRVDLRNSTQIYRVIKGGEVVP